ncbi:Hypothetical protein FKW44_001692, partial [Caligus rogercresseyi]
MLGKESVLVRTYMADSINAFRLAEVAEAEMESKVNRENDCNTRFRDLSREENILARSVFKIIDGKKILTIII